MNKSLYFLLTLVLLSVTTTGLQAGNPDRQGEAGAPELLMNPWARSAGLHSMTTSMVIGVESMMLNIAGLSRITKTEVVFGHSQYLKGTGITTNAFGFAQKIGNNSALGISIMTLDFGEIDRTTTFAPEGTGSTFSPRFVNIGVGFSHNFENKVSVGVLGRAVSEGVEDVNATGICLDAGVQYVTGERENFKFGISLRNIGGRMQFRGEGLSQTIEIPAFDGTHGLVTNQRSTSFEMQSVLNIGLSYDYYVVGNSRLTFAGNYTSNAFSEDQLGGGLEFSYNELVMLRAGYKLDFGQISNTGSEFNDQPLYTGLSAGATLNVPTNKKDNAPRIAFDYAYRTTKIYDGTHNLSVRITL
ncbi:MAG: PorV/PorQ family protein [Saprospiraceae bacterium]|nr:PorV/PorQ family protein [Saprospiraceae bacterium]